MPGLGFDKNGNRLGRGKGFYDLYLQRCMKHPKGKPYTIALAFKEQLCEQVPVDANDMLIDEIVYEDVWAGTSPQQQINQKHLLRMIHRKLHR